MVKKEMVDRKVLVVVCTTANRSPLGSQLNSTTVSGNSRVSLAGGRHHDDEREERGGEIPDASKKIFLHKQIYIYYYTITQLEED